MWTLAVSAAIEAFDKQDFSVRQPLEFLGNTFEFRLLDELSFRHVHADRFGHRGTVTRCTKQRLR